MTPPELVRLSGGHHSAVGSDTYSFYFDRRQVMAAVFFDLGLTDLSACIKWRRSSGGVVSVCAESEDPVFAPLIVSTRGDFTDDVEVTVRVNECELPKGCSYAVITVGATKKPDLEEKSHE